MPRPQSNLNVYQSGKLTVVSFVSAEGAMIKFLEDNKTWCGVPDQAIAQAKAGHEKSLKFRTAACTEAPEQKPKVPTLSDASEKVACPAPLSVPVPSVVAPSRNVTVPVAVTPVPLTFAVHVTD